MKGWKRRIKTTWQVLCGKKCLLTDAANKIIYVQDAGPSGKIVQLQPWRDQILVLDNNGSIWLMDETMYGSGDFHFRLVMDAPRMVSR